MSCCGQAHAHKRTKKFGIFLEAFQRLEKERKSRRRRLDINLTRFRLSRLLVHFV